MKVDYLEIVIMVAIVTSLLTAIFVVNSFSASAFMNANVAKTMFQPNQSITCHIVNFTEVCWTRVP